MEDCKKEEEEGRYKRVTRSIRGRKLLGNIIIIVGDPIVWKVRIEMEKSYKRDGKHRRGERNILTAEMYMCAFVCVCVCA